MTPPPPHQIFAPFPGAVGRPRKRTETSGFFEHFQAVWLGAPEQLLAFSNAQKPVPRWGFLVGFESAMTRLP